MTKTLSAKHKEDRHTVFHLYSAFSYVKNFDKHILVFSYSPSIIFLDAWLIISEELRKKKI